MRFSLLILTCISLSLPAFPAFAAQDSAEAQEIKALFQGFLDKEIAYISAGPLVIEKSGEVTVTPKGSYYAVAMPSLKIQDPESGYETTLSSIAANVSPGDTQGSWKMAIALPTPVITYDENNEPAFILDIGSQHLMTLWNKEFESFSKSDIAYDNVQITVPSEDIIVKIPELRALSNLSETSPDLYSGPGQFSIKNLTVEKKQTPVASIGDISLTFESKGMSASSFRAYKETAQKIAALLGTEQDKEEIDKQMDAHMSTIFKSLGGMLGNGFSFHYDIKDVAIQDEDPEASRSIAFGSLFAGIDYDKKETQERALGDVDIRLGYSGMNAKGEDSAAQSVSPTGINLDISFDNVPTEELIETIAQIQKASEGSSGSAQLAGMQMMLVLPHMLSEAGSTVSFNNSAATFPESKAAISGNIRANAASPLGLSADIVAQITNLDGLIKSAQDSLAQAQQEGNHVGAGILGQAYPVLLILKGMAETDATEDGKILSLYNLKVGDDGAITVNGTSLDMLMGK
jgi:hypothetical protein